MRGMGIRHRLAAAGLLAAAALAASAILLLGDPSRLEGLGANDLLGALACLEAAWFLFVWPALASRNAPPFDRRPSLASPLALEALLSAALLLPIARQAAAFSGGGLAEALAVQGAALLAALASGAVLELAAALGRRSIVPLYLALVFVLSAGVPLVRFVAAEVVHLSPAPPAFATPFELALAASAKGGTAVLADGIVLGIVGALLVLALLARLRTRARVAALAALLLALALASPASAADFESTPTEVVAQWAAPRPGAPPRPSGSAVRVPSSALRVPAALLVLALLARLRSRAGSAFRVPSSALRVPTAPAALLLGLALAAPAGAVQIESVRFATGESFRPGTWTRAEVVVAGGPFAGKVEIAPDPNHRFEAPVSLHDEKARIAVQVDCLLDGRHAKGTARLVSDSGVLVERTIDLPTRPARPREILVGVHPSGPAAPVIPPLGGRRVRMAAMPFLPDPPGGLSGVDVVILAPAVADPVDPRAAGDLAEWVREGGRLVLASPWLVTSSEWQAILFPRGLRPTGAPPGPYPIADLLAQAGVPERQWIYDRLGEPVGGFVEVGRGRAAFLARPDPGLWSPALEALAPGVESHPDRSVDEAAYAAFPAPDWSPGLRRRTAIWLGVYLGGALALGSVPFAFRRARRTGAAAACFFVLASTAGTWLAGRDLPARTDIGVSVRPLVVLGADGRTGELLAYHSLVARRETRVEARAEPGTSLLPVAFDAEHWHATEFSGAPDRLSSLPLETGHRLCLLATRRIGIAGRVRAVLDRGRLRVENGSGLAWTAAVHHSPSGRVVGLGAIGDGDVASIDLSRARPSGSEPLPGVSDPAIRFLARAAGAGSGGVVLALLPEAVDTGVSIPGADVLVLPAVVVVAVE